MTVWITGSHAGAPAVSSTLRGSRPGDCLSGEAADGGDRGQVREVVEGVVGPLWDHLPAHFVASLLPPEGLVSGFADFFDRARASTTAGRNQGGRVFI